MGETYPNGAPKNGVRYQKNADGTVNHGTQQRGTFDESGAFVSGNHRVEFADGVSTTSARRVDPVTGQSVDVAINSRNEFGVRRTVLQDGTYVARPKGEVKSSSVPATEAQSVVSTTPQNTTTVSPSTSNTSDLLKNRVNKLAGVQREPHNGQLMTETEAFVQNSAKRNPNVGEAYTAALQFKASKLNTYYDEIEKQFAPSETKVRGKNIFVQLGEDFMVGRTDITNFSLTNLKSGQKYEGLKSREEVKDIITQRYTHPEAARINAAEKAVLAGDMSRLAELAKLEGRRLEDYAVVNGRITRI